MPKANRRECRTTYVLCQRPGTRAGNRTVDGRRHSVDNPRPAAGRIVPNEIDGARTEGFQPRRGTTKPGPFGLASSAVPADDGKPSHVAIADADDHTGPGLEPETDDGMLRVKTDDAVAAFPFGASRMPIAASTGRTGPPGRIRTHGRADVRPNATPGRCRLIRRGRRAKPRRGPRSIACGDQARTRSWPWRVTIAFASALRAATPPGQQLVPPGAPRRRSVRRSSRRTNSVQYSPPMPPTTIRRADARLPMPSPHGSRATGPSPSAAGLHLIPRPTRSPAPVSANSRQCLQWTGRTCAVRRAGRGSPMSIDPAGHSFAHNRSPRARLSRSGP